MNARGKELTDLFTSKIGPALFRLAWWNHLEPAKREYFARDLRDVVLVAVLKSYESDSNQPIPRSQIGLVKGIAGPLLDSMIKQEMSVGFEALVPKFGEDSFERVVKRITKDQKKNQLNRRLTEQYDAFLGRTENLSEELISAVRTVNEEFMIWIKTHSESLPNIAWEALERMTGEILASHGMQVTLTGRSRGANGDILAIDTTSGRPTKYLVECKRYGNKIGVEIVNSVIGAKIFQDIERAMLVTTSTFTRDVVKSKPRLAELKVELRDGNDIVSWLREYDVHEDLGLWLEPGWYE